jgi:hypothetical protein
MAQTIELRRTFSVGPERLDEAWTDKDDLAHWFCHDGRVSKVEVIKHDVRPDGQPEARGHARDERDGGLPHLRDVRAARPGDGTELHLVHGPFASPERRAREESSGKASLDALEQYLSKWPLLACDNARA